jgi:hypothetical protein
MYVHLSIGVHWNPRLHYDTLHVYLVYPYESKSHDSMAMLSNLGLSGSPLPLRTSAVFEWP